MAVKIRLQRRGAKHAPFYRLVAADSRAPRDGRFVEILGTYAPKARKEADQLHLKTDRIDYWLSVGAQPTDTARSLIRKARLAQSAEPEPDSVIEEAKEGESAVSTVETEAVETPAEEKTEESVAEIAETPSQPEPTPAPVEEAPAEAPEAKESELSKPETVAEESPELAVEATEEIAEPESAEVETPAVKEEPSVGESSAEEGKISASGEEKSGDQA